jgi:hypothetical protein
MFLSIRPGPATGQAGSRYPKYVGQKREQTPPSGVSHTASPSLEEIAAQQGFAPIRDYRFLLGVPYPGDESVEELEAMLRE